VSGSAKHAPFPRSARLRRHSDFELVYKQGRRHFASHLTVFYLRQPDLRGLRVGFTVGRALGGAVERNRMKRRLREAVRLHGSHARAGVDVVINPKKSLLRVDFAELQKEIARAFEVIEKSLARGTT
jgi:ribonuclease P protein component